MDTMNLDVADIVGILLVHCEYIILYLIYIYIYICMIMFSIIFSCFNCR